MPRVRSSASRSTTAVTFTRTWRRRRTPAMIRPFCGAQREFCSRCVGSPSDSIVHREFCLLSPDFLDSHIPQGYQGRSPWLVSLANWRVGNPALQLVFIAFGGPQGHGALRMDRPGGLSYLVLSLSPDIQRGAPALQAMLSSARIFFLTAGGKSTNTKWPL